MKSLGQPRAVLHFQEPASAAMARETLHGVGIEGYEALGLDSMVQRALRLDTMLVVLEAGHEALAAVASIRREAKSQDVLVVAFAPEELLAAFLEAGAHVAQAGPATPTGILTALIRMVRKQRPEAAVARTLEAQHVPLEVLGQLIKACLAPLKIFLGAAPGVELEEMDVDAILARRPATVLVDELAHTNVPGSVNKKRYEDLNVLRLAGIPVVSTLNIQHLESLNNVVERITGVKVRETVPDAILEEASEVVLVDLPPEALQKRLQAGKIYAPEKITQSLSNFFTTHNLTALRELVLRELGGDEHEDAVRALRVHVPQLRRKLEANPARPQVLLTEPGVGYRLNEQARGD